MQFSSIQFTRLANLRNRVGTAALAIVGFLVLCGTNGYSQAPRTPQSRGTHRQTAAEGTSSRESRESAIQRIPYQQLTPEATARLKTVVDNSSYFRRMPTETLECDQEMFNFLVRHPEVIVNIWDVMDVTKVTLKRTGTYQLVGNDGAGTSSQMDLVYGTDSMHIYFANGTYKGNLWARELTGKCVVLLHSKQTTLTNGSQGIVASMDVFMKLDNIGADLVVKTLGPLVGKTADYNFVECAAFVSQISQTAARNPFGIQQLAKRLNNIDPAVREQFIATSASIAKRNEALAENKTPSGAGQPAASVPSAVPVFTMNSTVPPIELSSRRQAESPVTSDERVDSPTLLLIGKEDK